MSTKAELQCGEAWVRLNQYENGDETERQAILSLLRSIKPQNSGERKWINNQTEWMGLSDNERDKQAAQAEWEGECAAEFPQSVKQQPQETVMEPKRNDWTQIAEEKFDERMESLYWLKLDIDAFTDDSLATLREVVAATLQKIELEQELRRDLEKS